MNARRTLTLTIWLVVTVVFVGTGSGCNKRADPDSSAPTSSPISADHVEVVTNEEEWVCEDFQNDIRAMALKGDFQKLEVIAGEFRTNKSQFSNGFLKLRAFYVAFGEYQSIGGEYGTLITNLERWAAEQTNSITPRLALGEAYHGYAWVARGSGWASTVTDDSAQLMGERIKKSFYWLNQAQALHAQDPAFYAIALHLCLGADIERAAYERIFSAGVRKAPDYHALYEYKAYYLLPRWYGEQGEWEAFARKVMFQQEIPNHLDIFAEIAIFLRKMGYFYEEFSYSEESWKDLRTSFEAMESHYPDSLEIKSVYCRIARNFCDYKVVREQMKLMDGKVDLNVWDTKATYLQTINWVNSDDKTLENQRQQFIASKRQSN
jgi:hypothetical protein